MERHLPEESAALSDTTPLTTTSTLCCMACFNLNREIAVQHEDLFSECTIDDPHQLRVIAEKCWIFCHIQVVISSASIGCVFCKFIQGAINTFIPGDATEGNGVHIELNGDSIELTFAPADGDIEPATEKLTVDVYRQVDPVSELSGSAYEHIPVRPNIDPPNSETAWNYLRSCLNTCIETHDICKLNPSLPPPKRLLDVGLVGDGLVKLHETSPHDSSPHYVALSYCWGNNEFFRANKENLHSLKRGFDTTQLPDTIRDAIHITRKLGLKYLWVDALCIIQDKEDSEDWKEQSTKMCSLYEQAYLTIAASSVDSAIKSFLYRPSQPRCYSYSVANEPGLILVARMQCTSGYHKSKRYTHPIPADPIDRRGWALQEYLLPTRMISYSTDELQWRCKTTSMNDSLIISPNQSELEMLELWDEIVVRYTERQLTEPKDKLPALSGLCDLVKRQTKWVYLAGLWKDHLIRHLLWRRTNGSLMKEEHALLPSVHRAPSFSWASLDCPVEVIGRRPVLGNREPVAREDARLFSLGVLPPGDDPFCRDLMLILEGKLIQNIGIRNSDRGYACYQDKGKYEPFHEDTQLENFCFTDSNGLPRRSVKRSRNEAGQPTRRLEPGSTVSLFVLRSQGDCNFPIEYHILVLGISPRDSEAFERLGIMMLFDLGGHGYPVTAHATCRELSLKAERELS
ncbi:HET-domain-containing protein [Annulohypoxylon moriforme]|nr:HET-domain-containing protein [Annulohypoxylon moriforme]